MKRVVFCLFLQVIFVPGVLSAQLYPPDYRGSKPGDKIQLKPPQPRSLFKSEAESHEEMVVRGVLETMYSDGIGMPSEEKIRKHARTIVGKTDALLEAFSAEKVPTLEDWRAAWEANRFLSSLQRVENAEGLTCEEKLEMIKEKERLGQALDEEEIQLLEQCKTIVHERAAPVRKKLSLNFEKTDRPLANRYFTTIKALEEASWRGGVAVSRNHLRQGLLFINTCRELEIDIYPKYRGRIHDFNQQSVFLMRQYPVGDIASMRRMADILAIGASPAFVKIMREHVQKEAEISQKYQGMTYEVTVHYDSQKIHGPIHALLGGRIYVIQEPGETILLPARSEFLKFRTVEKDENGNCWHWEKQYTYVPSDAAELMEKYPWKGEYFKNHPYVKIALELLP